MTPSKSLLLLLSLLFLTTSQGFALEIVYPADKTVVVRSDFLIVKAGEKPASESLVVEINGVTSDPIDISAPEYKQAFRDFLILEPTWDKGKNSVRIKAYAGGKEIGSVAAEFYYKSGDDPVAILPAGYKPFVMHLPEKEALCAPCHNMKPDSVQLRGATSGNNPCAACHKRMLALEHVHGPEGVFQCADCHDSGSKPARWQVTKKDLVLCGECHIDKIDEMKKQPFVHGPVAVGDCVVCHDPHASPYPMQLQAQVNTLCLGCHVAVGKGLHVLRGVSSRSHPLGDGKLKDPANPDKVLTCVSCHNPHSGVTQQLYARGTTSYAALCLGCHKK